MDAGADKEDGSNCEHESTRCTARGAARPHLQQHADSQYTQSVQSGTCAMHTGTGMHSRSTDGAMTGQSCYDSIMSNRAGVVYDKQLWSQARQGRGRECDEKSNEREREREREREGNIRFTIYYDLYPSLDDV